MPKSEKLSAKQVTERMMNLRLPLSIRSVSYQGKEQGCPVEVVNGVTKYLWPDYLIWWVERERQEERRRMVSPELADSQKRKLAAEAETAELALEKIKRNLVEIGYLREEIERICQRLRAKLLATSGRHSAAGVGLQTEAEVQAFLDTVVQDQLRALALVGEELDAEDEAA